MAEKKASGKLARAKGTQKSAKSTAATGKKSQGFTDEERAAMKERAQELKTAARGQGGRGNGSKPSHDVTTYWLEPVVRRRGIGHELT